MRLKESVDFFKSFLVSKNCHKHINILNYIGFSIVEGQHRTGS